MTPRVLYPSNYACYNPYPHNNSLTGIPLPYQHYFGFIQQQPLYWDHLAFLPARYLIDPHVMAAPNSSEMEDFQRLSDDYRAQLPGPLIGGKLPMSVLATEYAQADRTYVVKTEALAQNYTAYRTIKGDGQCGWRAAVFGYFETLLQLGDIGLVQQERIRLQSFEDTMRMAGIDYDIIIDMFDYTWELFDDLQKAVERQDKDEAVLLNVLNDEVKSDSIVYHFKMMTSAYMQLRADQYEPFLEVSIAEYRVTRIDPSNQEIDQIGLQALTDAVIAPASFALEVLYLDRSTGAHVTPHPFVAEPAGLPTIRLLYRPGHYDMIYKGDHSVQVFFQKDSLISQSTDMVESTNMSSDIQAYLFSGPQVLPPHQQTDLLGPMDHSTYTSTTNQFKFLPQSPVTPLTTFATPCIQALPVLNTQCPQIYPMPYPSPCSIDMSPSPTQTTTGSFLSPQLAAPPPPSPISKTSTDGPQIRLNANCINYHLRHASVPLSTQDYGSTVTLSTAHFRNQDFQPQMWNADEEYLKA